MSERPALALGVQELRRSVFFQKHNGLLQSSHFIKIINLTDHSFACALKVAIVAKAYLVVTGQPYDAVAPPRQSP